MDGLTLTIEQARVLSPGSLAVEACPGAGKTRSIVARYIERQGVQNHGIALLSFTNRAVQEVKLRCVSHPHLLRSPNFVGTFDAFLHRFVVTPDYVRAQRRAPLYLRSWNELYSDETMVRISKGTGIKLSSFVWTTTGAAIPSTGMRWRISRRSSPMTG